jgi:hypothetical protein
MHTDPIHPAAPRPQQPRLQDDSSLLKALTVRLTKALTESISTAVADALRELLRRRLTARRVPPGEYHPFGRRFECQREDSLRLLPWWRARGDPSNN